MWESVQNRQIFLYEFFFALTYFLYVVEQSTLCELHLLTFVLIYEDGSLVGFRHV
jgi:hypothetical protein